MFYKRLVFGFKLYGICNDEGFLENLAFSPGSIHDNKFLEPLSYKTKGSLTCDAGYLINEEVFARITYKIGIVNIATRKNMKKIMTREQGNLFRKRSKIETIWGILKQRFLLETSIARILQDSSAIISTPSHLGAFKFSFLKSYS